MYEFVEMWSSGNPLHSKKSKYPQKCTRGSLDQCREMSYLFRKIEGILNKIRLHLVNDNISK